ncbi:hypothetical protein [Rhizohabitans arisaemae]|uniref:hypothetical protein n=1 Tax=Rhizohabitans arisaemae TaxID=2720610 RepID=UPI0024B156E3|nr:hypothetical protein [Rhizohabitans arisaemae]
MPDEPPAQPGPRTAVPRAELLAAFHGVTPIDPDRLRADVDAHVDQNPFTEVTYRPQTQAGSTLNK